MNKGFTLVEALVALTIITVGLIPAFLQASSAVAASGQIHNSLIAAHLAQEGVEVVHALRDANWIAGQPFDMGLTGCATGCLVQYNGTGLLPLAGNPPLKLDPLSGLYQYGTGVSTGFTRQITITPISGHELKIVSEVSWRERSGIKTYDLEYHVFDWLK